jgi:hypothetical protein
LTRNNTHRANPFLYQAKLIWPIWLCGLMPPQLVYSRTNSFCLAEGTDGGAQADLTDVPTALANLCNRSFDQEGRSSPKRPTPHAEKSALSETCSELFDVLGVSPGRHQFYGSDESDERTIPREIVPSTDTLSVH